MKRYMPIKLQENMICWNVAVYKNAYKILIFVINGLNRSWNT